MLFELLSKHTACITNKLSYTVSTLASLLHEIGSSMRCVAIFRLLRLRAIFFRGDLSPYYKILFLVLDYSSILYIVLYLAIELSRFSLYFSTSGGGGCTVNVLIYVIRLSSGGLGISKGC